MGVDAMKQHSNDAFFVTIMAILLGCIVWMILTIPGPSLSPTYLATERHQLLTENTQSLRLVAAQRSLCHSLPSAPQRSYCYGSANLFERIDLNLRSQILANP